MSMSSRETVLRSGAEVLRRTGGGFAPGVTHGETCDHSYNVVRDPVSTHDLHATLLHQLGLDHERLTYRFQGRDFRLTDVHGDLVPGILA